MKTLSKKENFFVYRFLDENQETLYVGKTKNLTGRIRSTHFANGGHLSEECYNETSIVVYSQCLSESDMALQERYLINTLNPKYNDKLNRGDAFGFTISCFDWKYLPFIRPDERVKKRKLATGPLAASLPNISTEIRPLAVPSLSEIGTFSTTKDNPGELYNLYSFGENFEPLKGLRMNGELWLSALSICDFSFEVGGIENSSKIRVIQFVKKGFLTCDDVCVIEDKAFCRIDYWSSAFGKLMKKYPADTPARKRSNGMLIRARALEGFIRGLLERHTRKERKRFDRGMPVKAVYRSPAGEFPKKQCETFEEYCDFMAGPNKANPNIFTVAYWIPMVCAAISSIETT